MRKITARSNPSRDKQAPRIVRGAKWVNEHKFWISLAIHALTIPMFIIGALGMLSFIFEETLQTQGFGYAIPAMNKEFEIAYGYLCQEEKFINANIMALLKISRYNPLTGSAFRAYANATKNKVERDKQFYLHMMNKEKREKYLAKIGR